MASVALGMKQSGDQDKRFHGAERSAHALVKAETIPSSPFWRVIGHWNILIPREVVTAPSLTEFEKCLYDTHGHMIQDPEATKLQKDPLDIPDPPCQWLYLLWDSANCRTCSSLESSDELTLSEELLLLLLLLSEGGPPWWKAGPPQEKRFSSSHVKCYAIFGFLYSCSQFDEVEKQGREEHSSWVQTTACIHYIRVNNNVLYQTRFCIPYQILHFSDIQCQYGSFQPCNTYTYTNELVITDSQALRSLLSIWATFPQDDANASSEVLYCQDLAFPSSDYKLQDGYKFPGKNITRNISKMSSECLAEMARELVVLWLAMMRPSSLPTEKRCTQPRPDPERASSPKGCITTFMDLSQGLWEDC
ncbi:hypothetical protein WISP_143773 [Willisornis vidua]|uniref:Uncharacterized protein n=1 Tax=Willisornis vidua TaxID=1566151 RepID=A0ABQ9CR56_9PASS|nr:hypothetical protein WISP_143773 [Willisornis vidua]